MNIQINKLPDGEFTSDGAYFAVVDGRNVGEVERAFWPTRKLARLCAERYVIAQKMLKALRARSNQEPSDAR